MVAAAFYAYNSIHIGEQKRAEREEAKKKIFDFKEEDLEKIRVRSGSKTFVLEKRGESWLIVSPLETETDSFQINELLRAVTEGKMIEKVGKPDDRGRFGLDPAEWEIDFHTAKGRLPHTLYVGNVSPTGKVVYVVSSRHSGVVSVDSSFKNRVAKSMFHLRNKRLFDWDSDGVVKVELRRGATRMVAERKNGGWEMVNPVKARADREKTSELIRKTVYARATSFADAQVDDAVTGLKAAAARISLWKSARDEPLVLSIGRESKDGLWVMASKDGIIATVEKSFLNSIPLNAVEFRDMRIFPMETQRWKEINGLTVERKGKTVEVVKGAAGGWESLGPASFKPDAQKIDEFFSDLAGMKAIRFISKKYAGDKTPDLRIGLTMGGKKVSAAFFRVEKRDGITGTGDFHDDAFEVSVLDFDILVIRSSDFEDRHIFPIREKEVGSLSVKTGGTDYRFVKKKDGWKIAAPAGKDLQEKKLNALLRYLTRMEFTDRLAGAVQAFTAEPIAVVTIAGLDGANERRITVMGYNEDKSYLTARTEENGEFLLISTGLLEVISREGLEELFQ